MGFMQYNDEFDWLHLCKPKEGMELIVGAYVIHVRRGLFYCSVSWV